jgi:hypothetical protein
MYKYVKDLTTQQNSTTVVRRTSDGACIPFDPDNTDYQAFLKYQAEGGKVYGADEEVPDGQTSQ